jgi:hypothetical protein
VTFRHAVFALAGVAALTGPGPVPPAALEAQVPTLDRVESLVAAGEYEAARTAIEAWWAAAQTRRGAEQARGLMLRAQLARDPAAAEPHYLSIVLGYPIAPEAPRALLRLGQGLLAAGDHTRAAGYLQRFVADYPGHPERTIGLLWLARARNAARQSGTACGAIREGMLDTRDPDLVAMFRVEEAIACGRGGDGQQTSPPAPPTATTRPAATRPVATPPATGTARFTAQVGAYRQQQSVDDIVTRLRRAGYEPRVALVPGSSLIRVRVGRFAAAGDASRLVARLKASGFDAVVVGDSHQEREP